MDKKFLVCGGDLRQIKVANMLSYYGYSVSAYGFGAYEDFSPSVKYFAELGKALEDAEIIILPLPCSADAETINMSISKEKLYFSDLFKEMNKNQIIVAGKVPEKVENLAKMYNIYIADYFDREELEVLNAIPTVEGALQIAMEETPFTIHSSKCLVLGYGRIGKLLAKSLQNLGANVTVSARKISDLAWIKAYGYTEVSTSNIESLISDQDIILNTIPHPVLIESTLKRVSPEALIIDLASKPGGVDFDAASQLGKKVIWALSLPGEVMRGKVCGQNISYLENAYTYP